MNPGLATHTINSKFADSGQAACDAMSLGCKSVYFFPQHQFNKQYEIDIYVSLVPNFQFYTSKCASDCIQTQTDQSTEL